jgi:alpha-beta hydrolase superfamily lysophospholipase
MIIQVNNGIYSIARPIDRRKIQTPAEYGLKSEKITFYTTDNFKLSALLIRTDTSNQKGTVILLHGIRSYKEHFLPLSKMLSDKGYNSIIVDLRAHGESEGNYCTFGYYEKHDISKLIDTISEFDNLSNNYGIWGQSLGGAIAIQCLEKDKRINFGIIESTFSDFRTIVHDYFKQRIGFDIPFISDYLIWRAENIANFKSADIKPGKSAFNISQTIIIAHGLKDDRIKIAYSREIYKNIASKNKTFFECPDANHLNLWSVCNDDYFSKVFDFIK